MAEPDLHGDIEHELTEVAGQLNAGHARFLELVAAMDRDEVWARSEGCLSMSYYLSWRCGISPGAARDYVTVARKLEGLPRIKAAFAAGRLGYHQVKALTRMAEPATEETLLEVALGCTAGQLSRIARTYRWGLRFQPDVDEGPDDVERLATRYLETFFEADGSYRITGRLAPEDGAVVEQALRAGRERVFAERAELPDSDRVEETPGAELVAVAAAALAGDGMSRNPDRYQVKVHLELASGGDGRERRGISGYLEDGPRLADETLRMITCEADVVAIYERDGGVLDAGRKRRLPSRSLRRALEARDRCCTFPGCTNTRTAAHHIEHWSDGGATELSNLVLLCRAHHALLHRNGYTIEVTDGGLAFRDRWGRVVQTRSVPASAKSLGEAVREAEVEIDKDTCTPGWRGERMNHLYVTDMLVQERGWAPEERALKERAREVQPDGVSDPDDRGPPGP